MAAVEVILDFWVKLFLSYKLPQYFLPSLKSTGLSLHEKKFKTDFQDGHHGGYLWFPIRKILASFDLQATRYFLPSFKLIGLSVQEKFKMDFQDGHIAASLDFLWKDFNYFWSASNPDTSYQVLSQLAFPFREGSNRFSKWSTWRPS